MAEPDEVLQDEEASHFGQAEDDPDTGEQQGAPGVPPEAVVSFGSISAEDEDALFNIDDNSGVWEDGYVINHYEWDKGLFGNGLTSPSPFNGNSTAVVQLYSETLLLVSDWTFERTGSPPDIPDSDPPNSNMILMDEHVEPTLKYMGQGGTEDDIRYRISGTYVYWFLNPASAPYCWPTPPWLEPGSGECDVSESRVQGIICCEGGGEGGATGETSPGDPGSQEGEDQD